MKNIETVFYYILFIAVSVFAFYTYKREYTTPLDIEKGLAPIFKSLVYIYIRPGRELIDFGSGWITIYKDFIVLMHPSISYKRAHEIRDYATGIAQVKTSPVFGNSKLLKPYKFAHVIHKNDLTSCEIENRKIIMKYYDNNGVEYFALLKSLFFNKKGFNKIKEVLKNWK